jgi:hypothetical protein
MKLIVFALLAWTLLAGGNAIAEPQELTNLRRIYDQKQTEAIRPIQQQYLRELTRLEDLLTSRKDLEGALAVRKERESIAGTTPAPTPSSQPCRYLADMHEKGVKVGHGAFTSKSAEKVGGVEYFNALYAHAPSRVQYSLRGQGFTVLKGKAGIRDGSSSDSVEFVILGDDKVLWRESMIGNKRTLEFAVPISGVQEIELQVKDLGDKTADWSAWLDPQVCK